MLFMGWMYGAKPTNMEWTLFYPSYSRRYRQRAIWCRGSRSIFHLIVKKQEIYQWKSVKAASCDISNWAWTAAVSLGDHRWSVLADRYSVCCSGSLQNTSCSLCVLPIGRPALPCTRINGAYSGRHPVTLFVPDALSSRFIYTFPNTIHVNTEATGLYRQRSRVQPLSSPALLTISCSEGEREAVTRT